MKIYLAGKITGDSNYKEKFRKAAERIESHGDIVLNPAELPRELSTIEAMRLCLPMLLQADAIALLPDWTQSKGADIECQLAAYCGIERVFLEET